jgi:hypothetical protein
MSEILNLLNARVGNRKREEAKMSGRTIMREWMGLQEKDKQYGLLGLAMHFKGFQERPGAYTESFFPVASDTWVCYNPYHTVQRWRWSKSWHWGSVLEGTLEEPAYIEWPEGMVELTCHGRTSRYLHSSVYVRECPCGFTDLFKEYCGIWSRKWECIRIWWILVSLKKHEGKLVNL